MVSYKYSFSSICTAVSKISIWEWCLGIMAMPDYGRNQEKNDGMFGPVIQCLMLPYLASVQIWKTSAIQIQFLPGSPSEKSLLQIHQDRQEHVKKGIRCPGPCRLATCKKVTPRSATATALRKKNKLQNDGPGPLSKICQSPIGRPCRLRLPACAAEPRIALARTHYPRPGEGGGGATAPNMGVMVGFVFG